jgi:diguanylate cyclase (GGDEF)-like protein
MDSKFLQNINILYVEDEEDVNLLTTSFLSSFVKNIFVAYNGQEGLDIFKEHNTQEHNEPIDLIITDINMPKMNGLDMIKAIHKIDRFVPVIVTTAYDDATFLKEAINQRVRGYVSKPLDMQFLLDSIIFTAEPKYLKDQLALTNKQLNFKIKEKTLELRSILDSQDNLILVLTQEKIADANQTFLDFFGVKSSEEFHQQYKCVCETFIKQNNYFTSEKGYNWLQELMSLESNQRVVMIKNKQNENKIFRVNIKTFSLEQNEYYAVSFTDITDLKQYTYKLQYKATHDNLTNLYNRQKLNDELSKEIQREKRYKRGLTLLMFDIDNFKHVNDTYGHDVGDIVIKNFANILKKSIRQTDTASRWGGEEFMVLLPETNTTGGEKIAQIIRKRIEQHKHEQLPQQVTVSIGVAQFDVDNDDIISLLKHADLALYEAKNSGKNKVVIYEENK